MSAQRTTPFWPPVLTSLRAAAVVAFALTCGLAQAGLFDDEEARKAILELRQKVEANRLAAEQSASKQAASQDDVVRRLSEELRKANEDNTTLRRSILEFANQQEVFRADLARMRGSDEQIQRDVAEIQRRQKDLAQGVDDRMKRFEPIKVSLDGRDFVVDPIEKRDFEAAMAVLRKGDFAAAQANLIDVSKRFPSTGYLPSILFWLGNSQYATKDYKESIVNFRDFLKKAPDSPRAAEAFLAIANCQVELKDAKAARQTLADLVAQFPQSEAAVAGKERLAKMR